MPNDTRAYDSALAAEAFGHFNNPLRRGAAPGNGFAIIDALVARMPPYPLGAPVPDMVTGEYLDAPCSNPRERLGHLYHTPVCQCGFDMGRHRK